MSFIEATRQNIMTFANLAYSAGQKASTDIARVGFLGTIYVRFNGQLTCTHATKTTFQRAAKAPYNLAERVRLVLNNGTAIWDTTGWGAYLKNIIDKQEYKMDQYIADGDQVYNFENTVSSTGAVNDINFTLKLPVSINDRDMIGLILLQNDSTVLSMQIDNAAAGVLMNDTDITTQLSGTWEISLELFSVPANPADYPNLTTVHQVIENQTAITNVGENKIVLPRGNTYLRIINSLVLNGALSDAAERFKLQYNLTNTPYNMSGGLMKSIQRERYGRDLPVGTYVHDFHFAGVPNMAQQRDWIYSGNVSEFDQFVQIASGATLGANNNTLAMIYDCLIEVTPIAQA